jgi:hypothetical protein
MRQHGTDKAAGGAKHSVQRTPSVVRAPHSILGLQGAIGNRAVQRLMASPTAIQRVQTIDDDVEIKGNLKASTVMAYNNGHIWGDFYVNGTKGTVVPNNVPNSAVVVGEGNGNQGAQPAQEQYNPSDI